MPFDLVVFTGDLGDRGRPEDYPNAIAFLKQTCAALGVPLDRLFVVPGNHDIDRSIEREAWESLRRDAPQDPDTYTALRDDRRGYRILERQRAFWDAVAVGLGRPELSPWSSPQPRPGYRQTVTLPGLARPIHVIGLDTAWLAGDDHDRGALWLTRDQVARLTAAEGAAPLPGLRIALAHHGLTDLADPAETHELLAGRVDLLLHGHQHGPAGSVVRGSAHQLSVLGAGCLYLDSAPHPTPSHAR